MNEENRSADSSGEEQTRLFAEKYLFLRKKIITNYEKGKRKYRNAKIFACALFLFCTVCAIITGRNTGEPMAPLLIWLALLFLLVFIFVTADYIRYLMEERVIPFLNDDTAVDYEEYDIFNEDEEEVPEEQEDD